MSYDDGYNPLDMLDDADASTPTAPPSQTADPDPDTESTAGDQRPDAPQPAAPFAGSAPSSAAHPVPAPGESVTAQPSTAATVSAPSGAQAPANEAAVESPAAQTPTTGNGVYVRRWLGLLTAAAVVVAGVWWVNDHGVPYAAPDPTAPRAAPSMNAKTVPGASKARTDQARAKAYRQQHGTYRGFTPAGTRVAASDHVWAASRLTDGRCIIYGVMAGKRTEVREDLAGTSCTGEEMARNQAELDTADTQAAATTTAQAEAAFDHLARTAAGFATTTFAGGSPTLAGLPPYGLIDGLRIVENDGTRVRAVYDNGTDCRSAVVTLHASATAGINAVVSDPEGC